MFQGRSWLQDTPTSETITPPHTLPGGVGSVCLPACPGGSIFSSSCGLPWGVDFVCLPACLGGFDFELLAMLAGGGSFAPACRHARGGRFWTSLTLAWLPGRFNPPGRFLPHGRFDPPGRLPRGGGSRLSAGLPRGVRFSYTWRGRHGGWIVSVCRPAWGGAFFVHLTRSPGGVDFSFLPGFNWGVIDTKVRVLMSGPNACLES